jgi:hypothetical protein
LFELLIDRALNVDTSRETIVLITNIPSSNTTPLLPAPAPVSNNALFKTEWHLYSSPYHIVSREKFLQHPEYDKGAVGALIFDDQGRLLIIQRASTNSSPGLWEIPGGNSKTRQSSMASGARYSKRLA